MSRPLIRFFAAALVAVSGLALTAVTFDAEAARVGKGGNAGRQSTNVTNQNTAQPSSATSSTTQRTATAPAAAGATAGAAAKTGASKWLGPLAPDRCLGVPPKGIWREAGRLPQRSGA